MKINIENATVKTKKKNKKSFEFRSFLFFFHLQDTIEFLFVANFPYEYFRKMKQKYTFFSKMYFCF